MIILGYCILCTVSYAYALAFVFCIKLFTYLLFTARWAVFIVYPDLAPINPPGTQGRREGGKIPPPGNSHAEKIFGSFWLTHYCNGY